ncbi:BapA/Bap/LapF family prefix-like domain-containing protein [Acinetobacter baumannii]
MTNFIVIEKDSLEKSIVNSNQITLTEASIVHTKMHRDDVEEFIRDGNNLLLKLKNGEVIVIENFFTAYDEVISDLVFEEDGCVLYWFDGISDFKGIPGLEVLLPEAGSQLVSLLPWLAGLGVVGGVIAATHDDDNSQSTPDGTNSIQVSSDGLITGNTENIPDGSKVNVTITGKDKDGNVISQEIETTVNPDGSYTAEVPNDFADGDLKVESEVVDQNGNVVKAEDNLSGQGGLDRVDGTITVDVDNQGHITGGTTDVAPGSEVILTITGQDQAGNPLEQQVTATVQPDGSYTAEVPAGFADGELTVEAETVDRNGTPVNAEDSLVKTDHDNDPSTPDQGGLDRVDGTITVDVDNQGHITGGTTDVAPGSEVILTITGQDQAGNPLEQQVTATVQPDGSYTAEVPAGFADGELTVEAETVDRNGTPVNAEDSLVKTDHDNDPSTLDQGGLDRVDGTITVDVDNQGHITGGTTDVAPGSEVILTITGQDQAGNPLEQQVTATVQPDGSYTAEVPAGFADGELTVEAETVDRNGTPVNAEDSLVKTDHDNDPSTPDQGGLDRVDGSITVDVDNQGHITGGTTDVTPGSEVILTITGQDQAGNPLEQQVTATVQPDGSYTAEVPAGFADGELTVEAETVDRNGTPVNAEDSLVKTDHDNDPSTPDQGGLDRVDGTITVDVDNTGHITGGTTDVAPGSEVILTITGQDQAGNPLEQQVTATVNPDGSYTAEVPAGFADGELTVKAETVDRNGTPVNAEDSLVKTDHDNDPSTPDQGGLDRVDGTITVDVDNQGHITGGTTDVAPGSEVILTITGQDQAGNPLEQQVTATVNPDGSYTAEVPAGFADGELTVKAETVDRNGTPVNAEDSLVKTDHDNDPSTPDQGGLDRVDGTITVDVDNTGHITGGTTDVAPGSEVILTITGQDQAGNPLEQQVTATVNPDGSYTAEVPAGFADGELTVKAETVDRNGTPVNAEDSLVKTDHDNDPSTPDQGGLDRVDGTITVDVDNTGHITGGTTDVAPGSEVILTITGQDQAGNPLEQQVTATVNPDGSYTAEVPAGFADGELTVKAETVDRNGTPVNAEDSLVKTDHDNDPSTPDQGGLDRVDGTITVDVDNQGHITGGTTDVAPGSEVILTITGQDQAGNPLEQQVTATVNPDGSYTAEVPAGFADGELTVKAETVDRNGTPVNDEDSLVKTDHDNDPSTLDQGGLDRVDGTITVDVDNTGHITGGTTDVAPGSEVILTITGQDQAGNPLEQQVTATVNPDGSYTAEVPAGFADGELTVKAETVDRNGTPVNAEDSLVKTDHDNDPSTPDQGGLDRVDGTITVDVDNQGHITGGTTDVAPGSEVILTITGQDQAGNPLEQQVTATVQPDGSYTAEVPAGFADGELTVEAETVDRNGTPVNAEDSLVKTDHDNDPSTLDQGGLDRVDGTITVDVDNQGHITGGTTDVAPGSEVILTITGQDQAGNPLEQQVTATVQPDGSYTAEVPAGFADGELTVEAETVDRNGTPVNAEDSLVKTDHDNDPSTPDQGGLDRVDGSITVDVDNQGHITGGTTDVTPGSEVILTITGQDQAGNPLEQQVTATVQPDGSYTAEVPAGFADGELTVEAETVDRNGTPVNAEDSLVKTDHDNDPSTPDQGGLDRVDGTITVDVDNTGHITGGTTDVAPGSEVILTITGQDQAGNPLEQQVTATVNPDGSYTAEVPAGFADGELTVKAETVDRNGTPVNAEDSLVKTDHDNDPSTPDQGGLDRVDGTITVDVDNTGHITGGTTDVAPGSEVILTITGQDQAGNPLEQQVTATVQPDGSYTAEVPAGFADGELVVKADTVDRNGTPVNAEDSLVKTDHDNNPDTPDQGGLDRVDGTITVDVDTQGHITGGTTDVAPGSQVTLTIQGYNENGEPIQIQRPVQTDADGHYQYDLTPTDGIIPASDGSQISVVAETNDRNGHVLNAQDSEIVDPVVKGDSSTGVTNGGDSVTGTSGDDLLAGDVGGLKTNFVAGQDYNISVVLDLSGSMLWAMNGTSNPPAGESRLAIAIKGLKAFIQQMTDHDGVINLQIASFSANGSVGNGYNQVFLNVSKDNINEIFTYLDSLKAGGGTYPEQGFNKAVDWFDDISTADFENQTYYLTDGEPNSSQSTLDNAFAPLAEQSKVFAVGVSSSISDATVSRYDNTDVNGNKLPGDWSGTNHGEAKAIADADKLIAYLIGGSENFTPADVGGDTVKGGAGDDILFGDAINTDQLTWTGYDPLQYPKYSGYSKLIAYLKAEVTSGAEPSQQDIYDYIKENFRDFIAADAADPATKGGNDTIYGGAGNDIIIAGAGNDVIYGGSGNDIISTGRGDDTIIYDLLNAADATGGNGTDTWVDYEANDKIEFGSDFFEGLLADKSNLGDYITVVDDGNGNATVQVDRDGSAGTHNMSDLLIIENQAGLTLQDLLNNNQIIIG